MESCVDSGTLGCSPTLTRTPPAAAVVSLWPLPRAGPSSTCSFWPFLVSRTHRTKKIRPKDHLLHLGAICWGSWKAHNGEGAP